MKKLLGILVLGLLWCNTVVALDEKTKNDPQMIEYMVKRKINFIDTKPISISEIAGWSHSCDKEDFIKYVGTVEGCIGIKKLGKIDKSKKKLVVFLHGDYKGRGSNNTPKYMAGLSKIIKDQKDNIKKFEELFDREKRKKILNYLLELDGIGETQVNSLETFFSNSSNLNTVSNLIKELNVTDFKTSKSGIFYGKTIMFTGGLSKMSRAEAKALVAKEGGKILGTASKKLDYLVVGDSKPTPKKVEKAKQLNIKILDENSWYGLLNRRTGFN